MNEYEGAWVTTYTGKKFHFSNPTIDEVCIEDIAHHLSLLCRFTGACKEFYSVAEHSLRVAEIVQEHLKLAALLHDAAEAYIGDISRPVKYSYDLKQAEAIITTVIEDKFFFDSSDPKIKEADNILIATEARDLMDNMDGWAKLPEPLEARIRPGCPEGIETIFLHKFEEYAGIPLVLQHYFLK